MEYQGISGSNRISGVNNSDLGNNNIRLVTSSTAKDGGHELGPLYGTINLDSGTKGNPPTIKKVGDMIIVAWRGWGRPNALVEPGMQWVATRTSVNIWHNAEVWLTCQGGKGFHSVKFFIGSKFPSHRLWINNPAAALRTIPQGTFSDLWTPGVDPTFVA